MQTWRQDVRASHVQGEAFRMTTPWSTEPAVRIAHLRSVGFLAALAAGRQPKIQGLMLVIGVFLSEFADVPAVQEDEDDDGNRERNASATSAEHPPNRRPPEPYSKPSKIGKIEVLPEVGFSHLADVSPGVQVLELASEDLVALDWSDCSFDPVVLLPCGLLFNSGAASGCFGESARTWREIDCGSPSGTDVRRRRCE